MFVRAGRRADADMRLGIDGVAGRGEFAEHLPRIAVLEQRAVAAPRDALNQCRNIGVEPDRQAVLQDPRARLVIDEAPAAVREDMTLPREQPPTLPAFPVHKPPTP